MFFLYLITSAKRKKKHLSFQQQDDAVQYLSVFCIVKLWWDSQFTWGRDVFILHFYDQTAIAGAVDLSQKPHSILH